MERPPHGLTEILAYCNAQSFNSAGRVVSPLNWSNDNLVLCTFPAPLPYDKIKLTHCTVHKKIKDRLEATLKMLHDQYPDSYKRLIFAGSFNPRMKRGLTEPSMHGLGCAIDFNSEQFPLDRNHMYTEATIPLWYASVVHCFRVNGFKWGGDFGDGMHFQYGDGY